MPFPQVVGVATRLARRSRGRPGRRRAPLAQRPGPPGRDRVPAPRRRGDRRARGRSRRARPRASSSRRPPGSRSGRGLLTGLRPGADLRQPLRVLLHLPAPEGDAEEPLRERRRLPALVPLRELHHAHPLHRARPRAGRHRAALAAQRLDPRHRSRGSVPDAAQPSRRDEPAVAARAARPRDRGPRPDRRLPWRERRGRARRHLRRDPRALSRARLGRRGPARREPVLERGGDAAPHPRRGRCGLDTVEPSGRPGSRPRSAGGWSTPRTSTTCSPGVPSRPRRTTRASPSTRTGSGWSGRFEASSPAALRRAGGRGDQPGGLLRLGRRRAGDRLPGGPCPGGRPCDPTATDRAWSGR